MTYNISNDYSTGAMHFAGGNQLLCGDLSCVDSGFLSFSFWLEPESMPDPVGLFKVGTSFDSPPLSRAHLGADGTLELIATNEDGSASFSAEFASVAVAGQWRHVMGCIACDLVSGQKSAVVYVNNEPSSGGSTSDDDAAFFPAFNGHPFSFGFIGDASSGIAGNVADVWIAPGVNLFSEGLSEIPLGTRRKFIDAAGRPVDLGPDGSLPTGTAPAIFFRSDPLDPGAAFSGNRGNGGGFGEVGGALRRTYSSPSKSATEVGTPLFVIMGGDIGGYDSFALPASALFIDRAVTVKMGGSSGTPTLTVQSGEYLEGTLNGTLTLTAKEAATFQTTGDGYWWRT